MRYARALVLAVLAIGAAGCKDKEPEKTAPATAETKVSAAAPTSDTIILGHVNSLTGNEATYGQSSDNGIKLAVEEQNKKNGIKGKKIVLKTYDSQGKPEESAVAATRLITQDHVLTFLGEVASSRTLAMAPIADSNKIPLISNASTNPRVTKDGENTRPYVFRVCFIDPFQGTVMAKFANEKKFKKVAVLRDVGNDYSVGLANFFEETYKKLGGEITDDVSFKAGDQDFKAQLTKVKGKNPEALYVPAYYTEVALMARQARELGMKQPFMGGDGWDSAKLFEIAKGALDGSYFSNHYSPEDKSPLVVDFIAKYKAAYGAVPDALAVLAYDAANVAFNAMENAKELTGPAVRDAIEATKDFKGVAGAITLDKDHNAVKPAVVIGIQKNAGHYETTVNP